MPHAADIAVGIASKKREFTPMAPEGETPVLLRKGALEAPEGQLDVSGDIGSAEARGRQPSERK